MRDNFILENTDIETTEVETDVFDVDYEPVAVQVGPDLLLQTYCLEVGEITGTSAGFSVQIHDSDDPEATSGDILVDFGLIEGACVLFRKAKSSKKYRIVVITADTPDEDWVLGSVSAFLTPAGQYK